MKVNLFSISWWLNMFVTTFVTILFIYMIKKMAKIVPLPIVTDIVNEV